MRTLAECEELIRKYPPYDIFNDKNASEEDKETSKEFKNEHGFVPSDVWNLDYTFACFILLRLCYFRDTTNSIPNCIYTDVAMNSDEELDSDTEDKLVEERWNCILNDMIEAFYLYILEDKDLPINGNNEFITFERNKQIEKGLNLFSKYFTMLWN